MGYFVEKKLLPSHSKDWATVKRMITPALFITFNQLGMFPQLEFLTQTLGEEVLKTLDNTFIGGIGAGGLITYYQTTKKIEK